MLAIEIEFLCGRYIASDFTDRQFPEWPPHPCRLYSALVASVAENGFHDNEIKVLRWLEAQGPPSLWFGDCAARETPTSFVPINDWETIKNKTCPFPATRTRQPRQFPSVSLNEPVVYMCWEETTPETETQEVLEGILQRVGRLGNSSSFVRMGIVNSAPDPVLKPDSAGDIMIRVPHEGRLETLQKEYALQRRPSPSPEQPYTFAQAKKSLQAEATPFGEMIVFSKVEGQSIPIESLKAVSSVMRDTVLKLAPQSKLPVFHGHGDAPHLAYVPLPFVGHEHADGHIMGIGIVLPRGVDQQSRLAVMQTLAKLKTLRFRDFGVWELKLRRPGDPARTLDPQTWSAPSRAWTTVTPILLDKFPKKKLLPEAILLESCQRTGLPEPEEVVVHEISAFPGVPWARDFEQREKPNMAKRASTHATFIFPRPVEGPFLLGAGRFFGLGVLRPVGLKSSN